MLKDTMKTSKIMYMLNKLYLNSIIHLEKHYIFYDFLTVKVRQYCIMLLEMSTKSIERNIIHNIV